MLKVLDTGAETEESIEGPTLDELVREGARRMLVTALAVAVAQYVDTHDEARDEAGLLQRERAEAMSVLSGFQQNLCFLQSEHNNYTEWAASKDIDPDWAR